jgi:integrase
VSRASPVQTAMRNCTKDEGGPFGFGNQVLIPSHRKPRSKAVVASVAETPGQDSGRHGRERRAQANRRRSEHEVERLMKAAANNRHGHRDATMILMAFRHGLRASELCSLRWEQVDLVHGRLHVHPKVAPAG